MRFSLTQNNKIRNTLKTSDLKTFNSASQAEGRGFDPRIPLFIDNQQVICLNSLFQTL